MAVSKMASKSVNALPRDGDTNSSTSADILGLRARIVLSSLCDTLHPLAPGDGLIIYGITPEVPSYHLSGPGPLPGWRPSRS